MSFQKLHNLLQKRNTLCNFQKTYNTKPMYLPPGMHMGLYTIFHMMFQVIQGQFYLIPDFPSAKNNGIKICILPQNLLFKYHVISINIFFSLFASIAFLIFKVSIRKVKSDFNSTMKKL